MKAVLVTLHSRYSHASLALPALAAACAASDGIDCVIREWTIHEHHDRLLRRLVSEQAGLYGFSCYLWNIEQTLRLVADLKLVCPDAVMVLGGPEVSFSTFDLMSSNPAIDCVVRGEGEVTFRELAELIRLSGALPPPELLITVAGITFRDGDEIIATSDRSPVACLDDLTSPFHLGLVDLNKPLVYVETSRGCPFSCVFCLSSLDQSVRSASPERTRDDLGILMAHHVKTIKLVDRTFNYDAARAGDIWEFILASNPTSKFHFEIAADLLTKDNFTVLRRVPAGMFRFEIGVQSGATDTLKRVNRTSNLDRLMENVQRLLQETGVIVHLDLVAGLPGEGFRGFLDSLEPLLKIRPHHLQVEPLKILKGAPIRRIAADEGYVYSASPPYKIVQTPRLSFAEICRIEDMGRALDLVFNSGRFQVFLELLAKQMSLSEFFRHFSLFLEPDRHESVSFLDLCDLVDRCIRKQFCNDLLLSDALAFDYCRSEYPARERLPSCFGNNPGSHEPRGPAGVHATCGEPMPAGARIRRYRRGFLRNYLENAGEEQIVELRFTYVAVQGQGERVLIRQVDSGECR